MKRGQRRLVVLCVAAVVGVPTGSAFAGGTPGPGDCGAKDVGANIKGDAKQAGPNAGPNTTIGWLNALGTPASPGQAVKNVCIEGNSP